MGSPEAMHFMLTVSPFLATISPFLGVLEISGGALEKKFEIRICTSLQGTFASAVHEAASWRERDHHIVHEGWFGWQKSLRVP